MPLQINKASTVELRQRKNPSCTEVEEKTLKENNKKGKQSKRSLKYVLFPHFTKLFFGCITAIISGMMYAIYLSTYHERKFWFSGRPELEREITFQGDSAIYYSFYKELLKASSFKKGIHQLTHDNRTLSLKTMNTVRQMTLYPELIASILYQASGSEEVIEPVYFYIGIVFGLQGIYVTALFITSWLMSGTWLAGMLTVAWFIINRADTTRIDYSIPARENWALPYFACQVAALTGYLKNNINSSAEMNMKKGTLLSRMLKLIYFYLVFTATVTLNLTMKTFISHKENEHLIKVLEVKLGLNTNKNFTVNWLLCQESLQTPSQDFFLRLTHSSLLPFYILVLIICLASVGQASFRKMRMKYVWTPYVCMIAAFGVCSPELWTTLFKWIRLKTVHPVLLALILSMAVPAIIGFSLWKEFFPRIMAELSELQEFYDPDTVGLMTWIKRQAPIAAVFAGSPQLMGVIRLCTGWMVTNLPLYNDDDLQKRNENIFQIYSKRSAEDIYKILTSYKATYLVIEDSICNEVGPVRGCRVKDLLDIANGHVYYEENDSSGYSKYGRFCQEIKMNYSPYVNYFTRVYWNSPEYLHPLKMDSAYFLKRLRLTDTTRERYSQNYRGYNCLPRIKRHLSSFSILTSVWFQFHSNFFLAMFVYFGIQKRIREFAGHYFPDLENNKIVESCKHDKKY
ncbi:hypothetical protein E2320_011545, partial [Naja naja]